MGRQNEECAGSAELQSLTEQLKYVIKSTFENMERVTSLMKFASEESIPEDVRTEILRAEVVLLHATLEDGLREILRLKFSSASPEILDSIWVAGTTDVRVKLGELSKHRGKTIDELIQESVDEYLDRTSFSSTTAIATQLEKIGIDDTNLKGCYPCLDQMIKRRHKIVHRADRGDHSILPIDSEDVTNWSGIVLLFFHDLVSLIPHEGELVIEKVLREEEIEKLRQYFFGQDTAS